MDIITGTMSYAILACLFLLEVKSKWYLQSVKGVVSFHSPQIDGPVLSVSLPFYNYHQMTVTTNDSNIVARKVADVDSRKAFC
mmetsp:Transcript_22225/g.48289  ORF Transcript_22225/g.48289 Transcript_22225/m.48289 type:complete len:83 (-) Transcript_22225:973-1221(-)